MISPCSTCPKFSECRSICDQLAKLLPPGVSRKYSKETPVSQIPGISKEDIRQIDRGAIFGADTDWDVQWDAKPIFASDLTDKDCRKFNEQIDLVVGDGKLRRRFKAFIKCDKMTDIARRANTSKQNIQKQFFVICKRIDKVLSQGIPPSLGRTPHQIKMRMSTIYD
jgi:hypothetical protein